ALEALVAAPGADEGLLDGVLGLEGGREHPVAVGGQLLAVLFEPLLELSRRRRGRARRLLHAGHRTYDGPPGRDSSQLAVEERDHPALVLGRLGRDPGDVLAVRALPELLRSARGGVEALVRFGLG